MSIQYVPNAAAISWLALSQSLDSRANMEGSLLSLFSSNSNLAMAQSVTQASNAQREADDNSKIALTQGTTALGGVVAASATMYGCDHMQESNEEKANAPTTEYQGSAQQMNGNPANKLSGNMASQTPKPNTQTETTNSLAPEKSSQTSTLDKTANSPSAQIKGENPLQTASENSTDQTEEAKENQAKENARKQEEYQRNVAFWAEGTKLFPGLANQLISTGAFNLVQANYIVDQGKAKAAQAIANGLNSVFNAQSSQLSAALSSCDSYMKNTSDTLSTLIQTSAVRG